MASVDLNALTEVQTPASTDNLLLFNETSNVATRIDYDKLAEAILNKTRSEIGGVSPISAIAALNRRTFTNVQEYTVTSTVTVADFVGYCKTITPYRNVHFLRVTVKSGAQSVFGTSSFVAILSFSSVNYGWILCLSDSKSSGGIRHICVNGPKAYVEAFANTETEVSLS